jgi:hypothetical protein
MLGEALGDVALPNLHDPSRVSFMPNDVNALFGYAGQV